ncbi:MULTISPECIES: hypothetical protein [unclassified Sulfitobacter]|uniref:hypothetical protein n=1 Tax=unclassified Sulfitobacter TaxID=196795 RepID=UPI0007C3F3EC|nr:MULTISPECIES: hypothetical protein [unclassified Sulfitobacter]KZX99155.1 hypothetical protein A3721_05795 [Sulfitobacter sp. HI0023]KZY22356.1 hypothetical protein A3728_10885 [Sulfitobacter sp. HI0040]KZZ65516.1 hypothetical protein A3764_18670 [Sulfitobacter sp. HI0129]
MKFMISLISSAVVLSSAAFAQTTTTEAVLGQSGNPEYPLQIQGQNGVIYNCEPEIVVTNGVRGRNCIQAGTGGLFDGGLATAATVGAGVLLVAAIAADDDDSTTTTTTP